MKALWCQTQQESQSKNWILAFDAFFFSLHHPDLLLLKLDFYFLAEDISEILKSWTIAQIAKQLQESFIPLSVFDKSLNLISSHIFKVFEVL